MNIGRFIPEILRIVEALQVADCSNALAPANWMPYQPIIQKSPKTFNELLNRVKKIQEDKNGMNWYLSFKEPQNCNKL